MKNKPVAGPVPASAAAAPPHLSRSQAALLATLERQPGPTTLTALVAQTGLHANTVREHLAALVRQQLVRRHPSRPSGRGRPAWLYQPTQEQHLFGSAEYAGLAATLASAISTNSCSPREDAVAAGVEWGRHLADAAGPRPSGTSMAARREVVGILQHCGFAPQPENRFTTVLMTRCPLLETARRYPDVICGVHLGIVRGALERYGASAAAVGLFPFSEPGACRLELAGQPARAGP